MPSNWPEDEELKLRKWFSDGCSTSEIAKRFGGDKYSRSAVLGKLNRLGLSRRTAARRLSCLRLEGAEEQEKQRDQNDLYLLQCRDRTFPGMPYKYDDIAAILGVPGQALSGRYRRLNEEYQESL